MGPILALGALGAVATSEADGSVEHRQHVDEG